MQSQSEFPFIYHARFGICFQYIVSLFFFIFKTYFEANQTENHLRVYRTNATQMGRKANEAADESIDNAQGI